MDLLCFALIESLSLWHIVKQVHYRRWPCHNDQEAVGTFKPLEHFDNARVSLLIHFSQQGHLHWHLSITYNAPAFYLCAHYAFNRHWSSVSSSPPTEHGSIGRVGQDLAEGVEIAQGDGAVGSVWIIVGTRAARSATQWSRGGYVVVLN